MNDAEKINELQGAVAELLEAITSGRHYKTQNPYSRPCVQRGMKALGRTADISTFGCDWMDVLDKWSDAQRRKVADRIDGYDRDDLGESPDY